MAWIIGLVAVIGFAYLMYANENFRRFGFGVLALIAAGIAFIWFMGEKQNRDFRAEMEREQTAISASQLVITNIQLRESQFGGWWVEGTVLNRSPHPLRSLTLTVFMRDCPSSASEQGCVTNGEDDATFYVDVPPGQARQLSTSIQFDNAPRVQPGWSWDYAIKQIQADLDPSS
jgi:hypothetical protein